MTRQEAIALVREVSNYMATRPEIDEAIDMAIEALKIQDESKTKNIIYDFLIAKLGEDIMNNPFKFEDWFNRMVWHVQECYKLNKKLLMNTGGYDLISRQAVLDKAYAYGNGSEPEGYCVEVEDIQALPPVVPTHKKGKWLPIIEGNEFGESYQSSIYCSECGETLGCEANFCPNCGARMESGEE